MDLNNILAERPQYIKKAEISVELVEYKGEKYPYTVFDPDVMGHPPELRNFMYHIEDENGLHHFAISKAVPTEYQQYFVLHEVIEYVELAGQKGRCLNALRIELKTIPLEMMVEYLRYRRDFFKVVISSVIDRSKYPDFWREVNTSYIHLQVLCTRLHEKYPERKEEEKSEK